MVRSVELRKVQFKTVETPQSIIDVTLHIKGDDDEHTADPKSESASSSSRSSDITVSSAEFNEEAAIGSKEFEIAEAAEGNRDKKGGGVVYGGVKPLRGRLLAFVFCILVTIILSLVKAVDIAPASILVTRNIVQFLLLSAYNCWAMSCITDILRHHFKIIFTRALVGTFVVTIVYCVSNFISLAKLGILNQLTPVFTTIFGVLILKEKPTFSESALSCLAIIGSFFVIQPEFIFEKADGEVSDIVVVSKYEYIAMGTLMLAVAAEGLAMVLNRKAGRKNIPCTVLLWAQSAIAIPVVTGMHVFVSAGNSVFGGLKDCSIFGMSALCAILVLGFTNQTIFLFANKYEKSSIVAVIVACCKVVFFFIADFLFFPDEMQYNYFHYMGGVLIVGAILGLLISNHFRQISFSHCSDTSKTAD